MAKKQVIQKDGAGNTLQRAFVEDVDVETFKQAQKHEEGWTWEVNDDLSEMRTTPLES